MKDPLFLAIEDHWRAFRPKLVQALDQQGALERAIEAAAAQAAAMTCSLMQQGMAPWDAEELARAEWARAEDPTGEEEI